jgi:hypothetical protein
MLLSFVVTVYNVYRMIKPNGWMDARDASKKRNVLMDWPQLMRIHLFLTLA